MKFSQVKSTRVALTAVIAVATLVASGCEKPIDSGRTAGQKLDHAIEKTNDKLATAGDKFERKVDQIGIIVDDSAITASIKADLLKDPGLSAISIEVDTLKGVVTLKGEVSTEMRKKRAESIALQIVGVSKVTNLLTVRSSQS